MISRVSVIGRRLYLKKQDHDLEIEIDDNFIILCWQVIDLCWPATVTTPLLKEQNIKEKRISTVAVS